MFESDDFDQVLSQFDFPEVQSKDKDKSVEDNFPKLDDGLPDALDGSSELKALESNLATKHHTLQHSLESAEPVFKTTNSISSTNSAAKELFIPKEVLTSSNHTKRKLINSHFDYKTKRKFPGPAGLLSGSLQEDKDDTLCHMELLSQDIEFSQNHLRGELFESPLWLRLSQDVQLWNLNPIDTIKSIKEQALAGNLRRRKAETVIAFVETVDRSATDPLIIVRDSTGHIKGTLHRDAWTKFSTYIVSEYCALVLWKPTVLTTGGAYKKHYLNITLSNVYAIYSSTVIKEEEKHLPEGYVIVYEEDFTVIKTESSPQDLGTKFVTTNVQNGVSENCDLLDDLDSIFSDDQF